MITLTLKDLADDLHNEWAKCGDSHKNTLDDTRSKSFKLCIAVLDELEGWISELVHLRCDQVLKHVDGGEAWD